MHEIYCQTVKKKEKEKAPSNQKKKKSIDLDHHSPCIWI